jgi:DNA-binding LacI/PurR family transcriptional regulator
MAKKATLKEVAQLAGVSAQTVSRVVNQSADVAPDTRDRVQQFINELGYQTDTIARSLITRHSRTLSVVATGLEYYGPASVLVGIQHEAESQGYSLNLYLLDYPEQENAKDLLNELAGRQMDGIIWAIPPIGQNRSIFSNQHMRHFPPVIFLNQPAAFSSVVSIDNRAGAELAVNHLIDQNFRTIGLISGPQNWAEAVQRKHGWQNALISHGLTPDPSLCVEGDWTAQSGELAFRKLHELNPMLDAVFVCNDQMALGVLMYAYAHGLNIPSDLAVAGFDDTPESAFFIPSLTTVRQPLKELGAAAVREMITMIRIKSEGKSEYEPKSITLQPRLIVRESSLMKSAPNLL